MLLLTCRESVIPVPTPPGHAPVSDSSVLIRCISDKEKKDFCNLYSIPKNRKGRHVFEPYYLDCSLGKPPQLTTGCGGDGTACTGAAFKIPSICCSCYFLNIFWVLFLLVFLWACSRCLSMAISDSAMSHVALRSAVQKFIKEKWDLSLSDKARGHLEFWVSFIPNYTACGGVLQDTYLSCDEYFKVTGL